MVTVILSVAVILVLLLLFKYFTGKSKPSESRSALEKIACSIFVIFRSNTEDAARSIRSSKVMKAEALQEVNDALNNLSSGFESNMISLKTALKQLSESTLPSLKDTPGRMEAKARKAKKDYLNSVENGNPIEAYKVNAKKFLQYKAKAIEDIKRAEKMVDKLKASIESAKATYDGKKTELEMIKSDIMSVIDIPQIELNESLSRIRSLQSELNDRMNQDNIRAEVSNEIQNEMNNSEFYSSNIDDEFDKL